MKAIVQDTYGSPDVLQLREIDAPRIGAHEVLVRVRAAGLDAGVWHLMSGLPYLVRLGFGLRKPRAAVRGLDVAGVVEAVGVSVTAFQPGDEVFGVCSGAFAELARASEQALFHKPANLTFAQAATVPVSATTALVALRAGAVEAGQQVLVVGAGGGVGSFAVQLARALGAEVTGVCSTSKVELARSLGAARVIDYTREDFSKAAERYDVIVDTGGIRPLSVLRRALKPRGRVVIVGGDGGGRWLGGFGRQLWALVLSLFSRQKFKPILALVNREDLAALKGLIEAGQVKPAVDRTFALGEAPAAVRYFMEGKVRGKVAISV